jgi:hypothetical protein
MLREPRSLDPPYVPQDFELDDLVADDAHIGVACAACHTEIVIAVHRFLLEADNLTCPVCRPAGLEREQQQSTLREVAERLTKLREAWVDFTVQLDPAKYSPDARGRELVTAPASALLFRPVRSTRPDRSPPAPSAA